MANTIAIRRRIRSVKNTQQITKAMKMVAAAKLRRAQERIFGARPYAAALREVLSSVATRAEEIDHPMLHHAREEKSVMLLVVTADKGLAGAFNSNAIRAAMNAMRENRWSSVELLPIGRKANDYFRKRPIPLRREAIHALHALTLQIAHEISQALIEDFVTEKIDAVYAVYNEFKSIIAQHVRVERLLPIERDWDEVGTEVDYLYEPGPQEIFGDLLPQYIEFQLYRILLESAAEIG